MAGSSKRTHFPPLPEESPEAQIANKLRALANRASENSIREIESAMRDGDRPWGDGIGRTTIAEVLAGRRPANKLRNVRVVARALVRLVPDVDDVAQADEVRGIERLYEEVFKPTQTWQRDFTRHCSNVAFDWASALPYGPRDAHELVATVAIRDDPPHALRTEVLGQHLAEAVKYGVMQAAPARKVGNDSCHLPNEGWTCNGDEGSTWHGMWGPVGEASPAPRFVAVHLDALGAVSVYLRVAVSTGIEAPELRLAALETAFQIVCLIGWRGQFGVLTRSVSPSSQAQKHSEYSMYRPSRGGRSIVNGPGRWTTHGKSVEIPQSLRFDDFYGYMAVAAKLARQVDGLVIGDRDFWPEAPPEA